eukprot:CAMPEP_0172744076 /NCGR_PEP_ID=MMETSP1074-20121228/134164_1 /TAXON_ID=2916 /ORGANISM="Ceratium fusus, Strain PA161109" /LENGTH=37 /DNA_ID= /DNA_START= /DNA_END= /DNA_ORIENTATION=
MRKKAHSSGSSTARIAAIVWMETATTSSQTPQSKAVW